MNLTELDIDSVALHAKDLKAIKLSKSDIFDAIYSDHNIFSIKHQTMQGTSTAVSYKNAIQEDMVKYNRENDGFFFLGQFKRSYVLTRIADIIVPKNASPQSIIAKEFDALEGEARKIINKYFKNRVVFIYRLLPTYGASRQDRRSGTQSLPVEISPEMENACACQPMLAICPIVSVSDLLYPDQLEPYFYEAKENNFCKLVTNTRNYAEFNFTKIICDTILAFRYSSNETHLNAKLSASEHPYWNSLFLHKDLFDKYLKGSKKFWDEVGPLSDDTYVIGNDSRSGACELKNPEHSNNNGFSLDSNQLTARMIVSLQSVIFNDKDIAYLIQPFDHVMRKQNKKALCDSCPSKLLCLLSGDENSPPVSVDVCRSVAVVQAFKYAEAKLNSKLIHRKATVLVIREENKPIVLTRKAVNLLCSYAVKHDDMPPEDWLLTHVATGTLGVFTEELHRPKGSSINALNRAYTNHGSGSACYLESEISPDILLSPIKKNDLSSIRSSNNSYEDKFLNILALPVMDAGAIETIHNIFVDIGTIARQKARDMLEYLLTNDISAIYENTAFDADTSVLEEYNNMHKHLKAMVAAGKYLRLNTKIMGFGENYLKTELVSLTYAGLLNKRDLAHKNKYAHYKSLGYSTYDINIAEIAYTMDELGKKSELISCGKKLYEFYHTLALSQDADLINNKALLLHNLNSKKRYPYDFALALTFDKYVALCALANKLRPMSDKELEALDESSDIYIQSYSKINFVSEEPEVINTIKDMGFRDLGSLELLLLEICQMKNYKSDDPNIKDMLYMIIAALCYSDAYIDGDEKKKLIALDSDPEHLGTRSLIYQNIEKSYPAYNSAVKLSITLETDAGPVYGYIPLARGKSLCLDESIRSASLRYSATHCPDNNQSHISIINTFFTNLAVLNKEQADTEIVADVLQRLQSKHAAISHAMCLEDATHVLPENSNTIYTEIYGPSYIKPLLNTVEDVNNTKLINSACPLTCEPAKTLPNLTVDHRRAFDDLKDGNGIYNGHIGIPNINANISHAVVDVISMDINGKLTSYANIKQNLPKYTPDYNGINNFEIRAPHANIWELDYSCLKDIRLCLNKAAVTKIDNREIACDKMPAEAGERPAVPMSYLWKNISQNTATNTIEDLIIAEALRHKAVIIDLIKAKKLFTFPDYDFDISIINSDPNRNTRKTIRVNLRHIAYNQSITDKYTAVQYAYQRNAVISLAAGTGMVIKTDLAAEQSNTYQALDDNMHLASGESIVSNDWKDIINNEKVNILTFQSGVVKDIIIEKELDTYYISWRLHGLNDFEHCFGERSNFRKTHNLRELGPELQSRRIEIKPKGNNYEISNAEHVGYCRNIISKTELPDLIRAMLLYAFKYTYKALYAEFIINKNIVVNHIAPVSTGLSLVCDAAYTLRPYLVAPGYKCALKTSPVDRWSRGSAYADLKSVNDIISTDQVNGRHRYNAADTLNFEDIHNSVSQHNAITSANIKRPFNYSEEIYHKASKELRIAYAPYLNGLKQSNKKPQLLYVNNSPVKMQEICVNYDTAIKFEDYLSRCLNTPPGIEQLIGLIYVSVDTARLDSGLVRQRMMYDYAAGVDESNEAFLITKTLKSIFHKDNGLIYIRSEPNAQMGLYLPRRNLQIFNDHAIGFNGGEAIAMANYITPLSESNLKFQKYKSISQIVPEADITKSGSINIDEAMLLSVLQGMPKALLIDPDPDHPYIAVSEHENTRPTSDFADGYKNILRKLIKLAIKINYCMLTYLHVNILRQKQEYERVVRHKNITAYDEGNKLIFDMAMPKKLLSLDLNNNILAPLQDISI